jgi:subtilisin family serine protease
MLDGQSVLGGKASMLTRLCLAGAVIAILLTYAGTARATPIPGQYIVVLKDAADAPTVEAKHQRQGAKIAQRYGSALKGYAAQLSDPTLNAVRADPNVAFVQQDQTVKAGPQPTKSVQALPNAVNRIDGDQSSTLSGDGHGIVDLNVAVLDSGIDPTHLDLSVAGGVDCNKDANTGFGDVEGHGTFVGGVIAARDNKTGVVGVAPGARLWSVRVLNGKGNGNDSDVVCGVDWVTATRTDKDGTNDIAVANMSLSGTGQDDGNCGRTNHQALHLAICASTAVGVTYVAAAGNDSKDFQSTHPATFDELLTATSMRDIDGEPGGFGDTASSCEPTFGPDDSPAPFSNFATLPNDRAHTLSAPGVCVASTGWTASCASDQVPHPSECYAVASGTSASAPLVAGTVALCIYFKQCAGLAPKQIVPKIVADAAAYNAANPGYGFTGDPLHSPNPNRYYGYLIRSGLY